MSSTKIDIYFGSILSPHGKSPDFVCFISAEGAHLLFWEGMSTFCLAFIVAFCLGIHGVDQGRIAFVYYPTFHFERVCQFAILQREGFG